ncbi:hypothetical protein BJ928_106312 [Rhizobium sp. WW_1]|jgi:hypothetical protein|nr:hypothetical protein BJ928_106312 [Rhizobium sp. WW_1]
MVQIRPLPRLYNRMETTSGVSNAKAKRSPIQLSKTTKRARSPKDPSPVPCSDYLPGLYQLSRPFWSFAPACSGVSVPLITFADSVQVSFSRFGVPRERI